MQRFFSKLCPVWLWFCQWLSLFLIQFLISNISFLFFFSISTSLFILSTCSYMLLTFSTKALFLLKHVNHSLKKFFLALYNKSLPYFVLHERIFYKNVFSNIVVSCGSKGNILKSVIQSQSFGEPKSLYCTSHILNLHFHIPWWDRMGWWGWSCMFPSLQ